MIKHTITWMHRKSYAPLPHRLLVLCTCLLLFALLPMAALAATGTADPTATLLPATDTQDGLQAVLTTDKATYALDEMVNVTVALSNTNASAVSNVQVDVTLPTGLTLTSGETNTTFPSFASGEASEIFLSAKVEIEPKKNSSLFPLLLWVGLGLVLAAVLIFVFIRRRKNKNKPKKPNQIKHQNTNQTRNPNRTSNPNQDPSPNQPRDQSQRQNPNRKQPPRTYALLLCLILGFSVLGPMAPAQAAPVRKSFFLTEMVTANGIGTSIVVQVSYDWEEAVPVTGVTLNLNSLSLTQGGPSSTLVATVSPADATDQSLFWTSSNPAVATVLDGVVAPVAPGMTTITVNTADGSKQATCEVQVLAANVPVTGITVSPNSLSLAQGGASGTLAANIVPANATNKNVSWTSSNPSVATVSGGVVSPAGAGTATITAVTDDGGKQASCSVRVSAAPVPVTGVALSTNTLSLTQGGDTGLLTATVSPRNATNQNVTWASSNTAVATVSNGVVTPKNAGNATITVTTADGGKQAICAVTVVSATVPVTGVSISPTVLSLTQGGPAGTLTATVSPSDATNKNVTWKTSNPSVATVSGRGVVTPVGPGTATITVTTADGSKQAAAAAAVTASSVPVTGVSVSPNTLSLTQGGATGTLTATVSPANATNKNVTWNSSNPAVATVAGGVVTPVGPGTATITVATADGGKQASAAVKVSSSTVAVTGVSVSPNTLALTQGGATGTLTVTVSPANATNKNVTWNSSNPAVATVAGGVVTPVGPGTATITVATADGGKQATCAVTVASATIPVTGVSLDRTSIDGWDINSTPTQNLTATVTPANATNQSVSWASNNPAVATVSGGVVTAVAPGNATITVTTADGGKQASCAVTIIRGGKAAANAEAAKVTGFGADTQGTNTETTLGFPIQTSSALASDAAFQLVSTSVSLGGSMDPITGLLILNTQNVVDATDLSNVSLVFTVTVGGTTSDPVSLPISALFGAESTAAKLRKGKATILALHQTNVEPVSAGTTTIPLNHAQLSPGVSMPLCPASVNDSVWPDGVTAATLSATAAGVDTGAGMGTGIVTINITGGVLNAGGSGSFAFEGIKLSCTGAVYVLPGTVTIGVPAVNP